MTAIDIDETESGNSCSCGGDYRITLYKGRNALVELTVHHGVALRWHGGPWPGDAELTEASKRALSVWFEEQGYAPLLRSRDRNTHRASGDATPRVQFMTHYPLYAMRYFEIPRGGMSPLTKTEIDTRGAALAAAVDDPVELAITTSRALGASKSIWSKPTTVQKIALSAMRAVPPEAFLLALDRVRTSTSSLLGAAQIFFRNGFYERFDSNIRIAWTIDLAAIVLTLGDKVNRPVVWAVLAKMRDRRVDVLLLNLARGRVFALVPDPTAYQLLLQRGNKDIIPEVKVLLKRYADKPEAEVLFELLQSLEKRPQPTNKH